LNVALKNKYGSILESFLLVYEVRMNETGDRGGYIPNQKRKERQQHEKV